MQPTNHPAANSSKKKNKKKKGKASAQESSDSHPVTPNPTSPPTATAIPNGTPLGHEEEDTDPNHVYPTSPLSHAFPPHPDSLPSPPPNSPPLRFPLETIMSKLAQSPLVHTNPAHLLHTDGTPNFELLKTADELYRQIETAAKEALGDGWREKERGDIPMPKGVQMPRREGEEGDDESYWTSLPANWKSFIKSALPLAATINGYPATANGQAPPEGVDVAAATLARVVESNWSSLSSLQNPSEQEIALSLAIQQARDKRDQARKLEQEILLILVLVLVLVPRTRMVHVTVEMTDLLQLHLARKRRKRVESAERGSVTRAQGLEEKKEKGEEGEEEKESGEEAKEETGETEVKGELELREEEKRKEEAEKELCEEGEKKESVEESKKDESE
ncbi:hypothetical protein BT69DRAFT_1315434 [Atractiella rhizophila]|nr:hypothetical protein BT69DRAFT_1315434 [Atractiella rhizophila]